MFSRWIHCFRVKILFFITYQYAKGECYYNAEKMRWCCFQWGCWGRGRSLGWAVLSFCAFQSPGWFWKHRGTQWVPLSESLVSREYPELKIHGMYHTHCMSEQLLPWWRQTAETCGSLLPPTSVFGKVKSWSTPPSLLHKSWGQRVMRQDFSVYWWYIPWRPTKSKPLN